MTNLAGQVVCDGCGVDLGNGSIQSSLLVSDVHEGIVETLHFCRDREDADGKVKGCARQVRRPGAQKAWLGRNPGRDGHPAPAPPP